METKKVTLTKIYSSDKDKQGNPLKSKDGRPYTRMSIKCQEYGDKWLSGFKNGGNSNWKEGDTVEIIVKEVGQYLNYEVPKKDDKVIEMLSELLTKVGRLSAQVEYLADKVYPRSQALADSTGKNNYPEEDISLEDMAF